MGLQEAEVLCETGIKRVLKDLQKYGASFGRVFDMRMSVFEGPRKGDSPITLVECISCGACEIDPFVIVPETWTERDRPARGCKNWRFMRSKGGEWDEHTGLQWFCHFLSQARINQLAVPNDLIGLIWPGYGDDLPVRVIDMANDNGIILKVLPRNYDLLLKPLDTGVYEIRNKLNAKYNQAVLDPSTPQAAQAATLKGRLEYIVKDSQKVMKEHVMFNAFKECGLFPSDTRKLFAKLTRVLATLDIANEPKRWHVVDLDHVVPIGPNANKDPDFDADENITPEKEAEFEAFFKRFTQSMQNSVTNNPPGSKEATNAQMVLDTLLSPESLAEDADFKRRTREKRARMGLA